jgi:hypothetical protein
MHESGRQPLFLAGGSVYTVADAIEWGAARGLLDEARHEALALLAAEDSEAVVDEDTLQKASEKFRYDRDLITAGETEQWLRSRGMTIEDFGRWLYATLARVILSRGDGEGPPAVDGDPSRSAALRMTLDDDFFRIHLWLSGEMEKLERAYRRFIAGEIEGNIEDRKKDALSDASKRRRLALLGTSLMRVEVEMLIVDSEAAGREAVLCVRTDKQSLAEVASDAGYRTERVEMWLEDFEPSVRQTIMGAVVGDAVGPVGSDGRFTIYQLLRRDQPALDHPMVSERVETVLIEEMYDDLVARHTQQPVSVPTPS